MVSKISSGAIVGVEGYTVEVEVDISQGLPSFEIVGLPDSSVRESRERVRAAIKNSDYPFPIRRITVNLAPADTKKEGPAFDLPVAVGILSCVGVIPSESTDGTVILGELSLDGTIRPINGVLPILDSAQKIGIKKCIVPLDNASEAALVPNIAVVGVRHLSDAVLHLSGEKKLDNYNVDLSSLFKTQAEDSATVLDFEDVRGQAPVKRALEIAAAGMHNILLIGPPGSGKTMMSRRLPSILPDITFEESIEITKIYSVAGSLRNKNSLITRRPFRAPHHTVSYSALVGGGRIPKPGEVSLAHHGVLFLDELPEFNKNVLEVLRQPLEDRQVTVSRVNSTVTFPSSFMLVGSMNPCPCGYLGDHNRCRCRDEDVLRYVGKISGPLLDRIDIHIEAPPVEYDDFDSIAPSESSEKIKARVLRARDMQAQRHMGNNDKVIFNSSLNASQINKYCILGRNEKAMMKNAFDNLGLSARAYHKILKVARTIADLDGSQRITEMHIGEAIQYRGLDRKL